MGRRHRLVLFIIAAAASVKLFWQGHGTSPSGISSVAFVRYSTHSVVVRLQGYNRSPCIYKFSDGTTVLGAIKMTAASDEHCASDRNLLDARLKNGDIVEIRGLRGQPLEISITKMKSRERMLLGVPLNPDEMEIEDWDALPGIGPALAKTIVADRQNNGDFGSVQALKRVPGVGEGTLKKIGIFF